MTSSNDKTKKSLAPIAFTLAVLAVLIVSMTGVMAADKKMDKKVEVAVASVKFIDEESGLVLLMVDKTRKISDLERGDEIEIMMEEETDKMKKQRPRKWRMQRYPYGGPVTP